MSSAIVGFVPCGDPVITGDMIPLQEGLSVIYGLNGTGKTRFLRGVRAAINGAQSDVRLGLLVTLRAADSLSARSLTTALARAIAGSTYVEPADRDIVEEYLAEFLVGQQSMNHHNDLRREIADSRLIFLFPTGSVETPSWVGVPVVDLERPAGRIERDLYDQLWEQYDDYNDEHMFEADARKLIIRGLGDAVELKTRRSFQVTLPERFGVYTCPDAYWPADESHSLQISDEINFGLILIDEIENLNDYTKRCFQLLAPVHRDDPQENSTVTDWARAVCDSISASVQNFMDSIFTDPPRATLHLARPEDRFFAPDLHWSFTRGNRGSDSPGYFAYDKFEEASLSKAELKWIRIAVALGLHAASDDRGTPVLVLIDEPEDGLHRAAEHFMAQELERRSLEPNTSFIVSTHSPELLDLDSAHLYELTRLDGSNEASTIRELDRESSISLQSLGLRPSDLLWMQRVILLVEGTHDQVLVETFLARELNAARAVVVPIRGGTKLPATVDSQVLFEFTRAHIIGLVDNGDGNSLLETWDEACKLAVTEGNDAAISFILQRVGSQSDEARFISNWLTKALSRGFQSRLTPYALSAKDVIEYLPVQDFVLQATSWEALKLEHQSLRSSGQKGVERDFKTWLRRTFDADFSPKALRASAERIPTPHDFIQLGKLIAATASEV